MGFVVDKMALGRILSEFFTSFLSGSFQQCSILIFSRPKQLHDDLKEKGGCWKWKEEALDRTPAELVLEEAVDMS